MANSTHMADILWNNPIIHMQMNRRLRKKAVVIWGLMTFIPCLFVFLNTYDATYFVPDPDNLEMEAQARTQAFKACFIPMLIAQAIILLFAGIGSVAAQLGEEKESGLLDYHRMTPMTPAAKIIGYLFGLPCREYLLFFLTVPFSMVATIFGKLPIGKVLLLYTILFCLVIAYHLTAMVAGMLAKRPRRASWLARVSVLMLYISLHAVSQAGLHIFGHITFIPSLFSLFKDELSETHWFRNEDFAEIWESVPFFFWDLPPALFTFFILGLMMVICVFVLLRKWKKDTYHPFTKKFAIGLFITIQFLIVGSFVPLIVEDNGLPNFRFISSEYTLASIHFIYILISVGICILLLHIITPNQHTLKNGLRRVRKSNMRKVPFNWDAASSLPSCIAFLLVIFVGYIYLINMGKTHMALEDFDPTSLYIPLGLAFLMILYIQSSRTMWQSAGFFGFLALFWLVPLLCGMTISAFSSEEDPFFLLGIPNPIMAIYHCFTPPFEAIEEGGSHKTLSIICHGSVAVIFLVKAINWRKKIYQETQSEEISSTNQEITQVSESAQ